MGSGILDITATDEWLSLPAPKKNENLKLMWLLWDAANNSERDVWVDIVDTRGRFAWGFTGLSTEGWK